MHSLWSGTRLRHAENPRSVLSWSGAPIALVASTLVLGMATLLCVFRCFSLNYPAAGLDPAWAMVLGEAAQRSARWGVDIVFTYGPASALVTRYFTESYFWTVLPLATGCSLVIGFAMSGLVFFAAAGRRHPLRVTFLGTAAFAAALFSNSGLDPDGLVFAFGLIVLLVDLRRATRDRVMLAAAVLGAAVLGVAALCKTSYGIAGCLVLLLADARSVLIPRLPVLTPTFLAAFLIAFLAYGQHVGDLPSYILLQGQMATGYGEAMYLTGSRLELILFLLLALVLVGAATTAEWRFGSDRWARFAAPLGTLVILSIAFKAGFVREDTHPQIAWGVLGFSGLSLALATFPPRFPSLALVAGGASLAVMGFLAPGFFLRETEQPVTGAGLAGLYRDWVDAAGGEGERLIRFLGDPADTLAKARAGKTEALAQLRHDAPLPKLDGTVDMLASDQGTLLANELTYHPRPSFAEYSTYTAGLIEANAAFYADASAPDWVLFNLGAGGIDGRYPAMTEGALWPELLRDYEPAMAAGDGLALHRRPIPLPDPLGPERVETARLGEPHALEAPGPVFARISLRKTLLGALVSALFRPPALIMRITLADGQTLDYRYIPALGAGGFLLSPMIDDSREFGDLASGLAPPKADKKVTAILIGGSSLASWFYETRIDIALRPVTLARSASAPVEP